MKITKIIGSLLEGIMYLFGLPFGGSIITTSYLINTGQVESVTFSQEFLAGWLLIACLASAILTTIFHFLSRKIKDAPLSLDNHTGAQ